MWPPISLMSFCDPVQFIWNFIAILCFSRNLLNNSKHLSSLASVINSKLWHCASFNSNNLNCVLRFCYPELCLFLTLLYYNKLLPFRTKYSNSSWTCSAGPPNQSHFDSGSLCGIQSNASGLLPPRLIWHACWMLPPNLLAHYIARATLQWGCTFFPVLKMGRVSLYKDIM